MIDFFQFMVDICVPFLAMTIVLCIVDWIVVMFKRVFSNG